MTIKYPKTCYQCKIPKEKSGYIKHCQMCIECRTKIFKQKTCLDCNREFQSGNDNVCYKCRTTRKNDLTKNCTKCKKRKNKLTDFSGRVTRCKECIIFYTEDCECKCGTVFRRSKNGKKLCNTCRGKRENIIKTFRHLRKDLCEICGSTEDLCIDHNHETDKYRGTLCRKCNAAIGSFNDDPILLIEAARYVMK